MYSLVPRPLKKFSSSLGTKLFTENITEYIAHAQAVCTRPLLKLGGGGGGGRGLRTRLQMSDTAVGGGGGGYFSSLAWYYSFIIMNLQFYSTVRRSVR